MNVAFALAFEHPTPKPCYLAGRIIPGNANTKMADWLKCHATDFDMILTQEAVFVALHITNQPTDHGDLLSANIPQDGTPINGTPVYRMHAHDPLVPIRTLSALRFALCRFGANIPETITLIAHQAQFSRAYKDLKHLYGRTIRNPVSFPPLPYATPGRFPVIKWAIRERFLARPLEALQRSFARYPQRKCSCLPLIPPLESPSTVIGAE